MEHAPAADGSPWGLGYQMNERYLKWDSSAQRQLILIWVAQQLDISLPELEERVAELALLLPDLDSKLDRLQVGGRAGGRCCEERRGSSGLRVAPPAAVPAETPPPSAPLTRPPRPAQAKLVLSLVRDLPGVTARILELRGVLPNLNLSALLAQYPWCVEAGRGGGLHRGVQALPQAHRCDGRELWPSRPPRHLRRPGC